MAVSKADANVVIKVNVQDKEARAKLLGIAAQLKVLDQLDPQPTGGRRQSRLLKFASDLDSAGKKLDSLVLKANGAKLSFDGFTDSMKNNTDSITANKAAWGDLRLNFVGLTGQLRDVRNQFGGLKKDTNSLYDSLKKLDVELRQKSKDVTKLKQDFDKFDKSLNRAKKAVDKTGQSTKQFGKWLSQMMRLAKFIVIEFGVMSLVIGGLKLALVSGELAVRAFNATMRGLGVGVGWTAGAVVAGVGTILAAVRQLNMAKIAPLIAPQVKEGNLGAAAQSSLLESSKSLAMFETQTLTAVTAEAARAGKTIDSRLLGTIQTLGNFAIAASDPNTALADLTRAFLQAEKGGKVTEEIFESIAQASPDLKKGFEEVYGSEKKLEEALKSGKVSFSALLEMFKSGKVESLKPFDDALNNVNDTLVGRLKQSLKGVKEQLIELGAPLLETLVGPLAALEHNVTIFLFKIRGTVQKVFSDLIPEDGGSTMPRFFDSLAKAVNEHLPKMVGFLGRMMDGWRSFSSGWNNFFGKIGSYLREVTASWDKLWNQILKPIGTEFFEIVDHAIKEFGGFIEGGQFEDFASQINEISNGIKELITGFNELRKIMAPIVDSFLTLLGALSQILKLPGLSTLAATMGLGLYMTKGGGPASRQKAQGKQPGMMAKMAGLPATILGGVLAIGGRRAAPVAGAGAAAAAPTTLRQMYAHQRNTPIQVGTTTRMSTPSGMGLGLPMSIPVRVPVMGQKGRLASGAYAAGQRYSKVTRGQKAAGIGAAATLGGMYLGSVVGGTDPTNEARSMAGGALSGAASGAATGAMMGAMFGPKGAAVGAIAGGLIGGVSGLFSGRSKAKEAKRVNRVDAEEMANKAVFDSLINNDLPMYTSRLEEVRQQTELVARVEELRLKNTEDLTASEKAYLDEKELELAAIKDLTTYGKELNNNYKTLQQQEKLVSSGISTLGTVLGISAGESLDLAKSLDIDLGTALIGLDDIIAVLGYTIDGVGLVVDDFLSRAQASGRFLDTVLRPVVEAMEVAELAGRREKALAEFGAAIETGDKTGMTSAAGDIISLTVQDEMEKFNRGEIDLPTAARNINTRLLRQKRTVGEFYNEQRPGETPVGATIFEGLSLDTVNEINETVSNFSKRLQVDPQFAQKLQLGLRKTASDLFDPVSKAQTPEEINNIISAGTLGLSKLLEKEGVKFDENQLNALQDLLAAELTKDGPQAMHEAIKSAIAENAIRINWTEGAPAFVLEGFPAPAPVFPPSETGNFIPADRLDVIPGDGLEKPPYERPRGPMETQGITLGTQGKSSGPAYGKPAPNPGTTLPTTPPVGATPASGGRATTTANPLPPSVVMQPGAVTINVTGVTDPEELAIVTMRQIERAADRAGRGADYTGRK
jgi:hypothetical protein